VNAILSDVAQKEKEALKLWEERKFEKVVCFLQNIQQGPKFVKHPALATGFTERYTSITLFFSKCISNMEEKVF
jgi:hypothetical protein